MVQGVIHRVYFSGTDTTKTVVNELAGKFAGERNELDLLRRPLSEPLQVSGNDLAIVGMPVFSGRIPGFAAKSLKNLRGDGTPVIAVVVYGNREFDDALLELKELLGGNGFDVVAAAAFIAQHSIFPEVARGRPDKADLAAIADFAERCRLRLADPAERGRKRDVPVKGNFPYKVPGPGSLVPTIDKSCVACGKCVDICPVDALRLDAAAKTAVRDDARCISCVACVHVCPVGAQAFRGEKYEQVAKVFAEKVSARREPEFFL